jgi:hypothetical protein
VWHSLIYKAFLFFPMSARTKAENNISCKLGGKEALCTSY